MAFGKQNFFLFSLATFLTFRMLLFTSPFAEDAVKRAGLNPEHIINANATSPLQTAFFDLYNSIAVSNQLFIIGLVVLGAFGSATLRHAVIGGLFVMYSIIATAIHVYFPESPLVFRAADVGIAAVSLFFVYTDKIHLLNLLTPVKKRNAWSNVAFFFRFAFGLLWSAILVLDVDRYIDAHPPAAAAALGVSTVRRFAQVQGAALGAVCLFGWIVYERSTKRELSALLGLSILYAVHFMNVSTYNAVVPVDHASIGIGLFQIALLIVGLAANEGVALVQDGGLFNTRNALGLISGAFYIFWVSGHRLLMPIDKLSEFVVGGKVSTTTADLFLIHNLINFQVVFVLFAVWIFGNASSVRAALFAVAARTAVLLGYWVLVGSAFVIQKKVAVYYAQSGAMAAIALIALHRDTNGNILGWLRSEVFHWTYSPARGGLYVYILAGIAHGVATLFGNSLNPAVSAAVAAGGIEQFLTRGVAIWILVWSLVLYIIVRVANKELLSALTWSYVFWTISHTLGWLVYSANTEAAFRATSTDLIATAVVLGGLVSPFALSYIRKSKGD